MELIWTAFLLGLVGSLHCAAMCGPLVLSVASACGARQSCSARGLIYHAGRIFTYCAIGVLFGGIGKTLVLVGFQRWLSIIAGAAILAGFLCSTSAVLKTRIARMVLRLKSTFSRLLRRRTSASQFTLGALNGLLPCGLVYVAAAGAAATGHPTSGALYMAAFGTGTLPMLLGLSWASRRLPSGAMQWRRLVPICVTAVAMLLLLRGMALGIPYVSPALAQNTHAACH